MNRRTVNYCLLFVLLSTDIAFALPEDSQQTLQVQAGSADLNQQTHRGIFRDDVTLDQGSTHLQAHHAETISNMKNQLVKAILTGGPDKQVHYWTLTATNKPLLHAYADIIHFYPDQHLIKLLGHARVEQGLNSFSAPIIIYDTEHQHVISKASNKGQTTIIFHPEKRT